ncbi:MAG: DUF945 family protein [Gammaproteobacteria bacterium]|nr:DUF945 family protein [Gammaproteobacteria bacterium]
MRRRNKLALTVAAIAGIYLLLPFCFGIVAQRYTHTFLEHENKTLGSVLDINVNLAQYHRGWFHSTAVLQIERKISDGSFVVVKQIPVVIDHGPGYTFNGRVKTGFAVIKSDPFSFDDQSSLKAYFEENIGFANEHSALIASSRKTNEKPSFSDFRVDSFILSMTSDLNANAFHFQIDAHGLRFQDPKKSFSVSIRHLKSALLAQYLSDRHWQLNWGINLRKNQLSTILPDGASTMLTLNTDRITLANLHFDTQKMATIAGEMVELKQATDSGQPIKATAWMALFQQLLTQVIQNDTTAAVSGLSVATPLGQLVAHYSVSFPTLPSTHDYFDVATRNVGNLQLDVPQWRYLDAANSMAFALKGLHYTENNDTVFSRNSSMTLDSFEMQDTQNPQTLTKTPILALTGLAYQGELSGNPANLSQTMHWQLAKLCFSDGCFNQSHGKLELINMSFNAFRAIAAATQQVVQYNPQNAKSIDERWMNLANAYAKLITPKTKVVLTHDMTTPEGSVSMEGNLSWPNLTPSIIASADATQFMDQAIYEFRLLFPAIYVNAFLDDQKKAALQQKPPAVTRNNEPSFEMQAVHFLQYCITQGYLKKVGDAYTVDLTGKGSVIMINGTAWKAPS